MDALTRADITKLRLHRIHYDQMKLHASRQAPNEACGIVAGINGISAGVYPTTNIYQSSTRFKISPEEQLSVFIHLEHIGHDLLAIYHSHPNGNEIPSATDIREFHYPHVLTLIWYKTNNHWDCRAYHIRKQSCIEIPVKIIP